MERSRTEATVFDTAARVRSAPARRNPLSYEKVYNRVDLPLKCHPAAFRAVVICDLPPGSSGPGRSKDGKQLKRPGNSAFRRSKEWGRSNQGSDSSLRSRKTQGQVNGQSKFRYMTIIGDVFLTNYNITCKNSNNKNTYRNKEWVNQFIDFVR